ncbi:30S ribosomal protein S2 [Halopseudomonas pachastrellae]|nr:30S ribosomal protein S2 [Halopseudomonas pachastrellae]
MRDMLKAGAHFGHQTRYWNRKWASSFSALATRFTSSTWKRPCNVPRSSELCEEKLAAGKNKILFVGTKRAASKIIADEAARAGQPYVDHRWLGGMLTNYNHSSVHQASARPGSSIPGRHLRQTDQERSADALP